MAPDVHAALTLPPSSRGSVTLVVLCLMTALGIALGSYLTLCTRSAQFSSRSVSLDQVQQLAQTGLEEALWALNQNTWSTSGPAGTTAWVTSGPNRTATLTYPLSAPYTSGTVVLTVANYTSPVLTVATYVSSGPTITSAATLTLQSGQTFTKTLQATAGLVPLFGNAIASSDSYVAFTGRGTIDSWYSGSGATATPYSFTPPGNATNYAAVIAGRSNGSRGVVLTQSTLQGYAATFGLGISYDNSGAPPPKIIGPSTPSAINIDPTRIGRSAFVPTTRVFTVTPPPASGSNFGGLLNALLTPLTDLLGLSSTTDVYKVSGDLTIDGAVLQPNVTISRPVRLIVAGDFAVDDGVLLGVLGPLGSLGPLGPATATHGKITITNTGSLELFVAGSVKIAAQGIVNNTNDPKKLAIYCTGSASTAVIYSSAAPFCGVIYSENSIEIQNSPTFYGALLSHGNIHFSGSTPIFHYDTALRNVQFPGIKTPYVIKQQTEP